jgi:hypothetical protein
MSDIAATMCAGIEENSRRGDAGRTRDCVRGGKAATGNWMSRFWVRLTRQACREARRVRPAMRVAAVQHLHGGAAVYALDVDGRRLLFAVAAHWGCLLSCYPVPAAGREFSGQTQNVVPE